MPAAESALESKQRPAVANDGRSFFVLDRLRSRWFALAVGLAASLPAVTAGFRATQWGWQPVGDDGTIALRSFDALTARTPQLGQFSTVSEAGSSAAHSSGPMIYWLFALPARFGPAWLPAVCAALVTVACFVAVVVLVERRAGPVLAAITGLGLALSARAIDPFSLASIWNPVATLAPFTLLLFVAWSVAHGSRRLYPLAVVLASLVIQSHLTYFLPSMLALGIATIFGFGPALRRGHDENGRSRLDRTRWLAAGAGVGALCWALPLWQQVTGDPGNATVLARSGGSLGPGLGVRRGIYALVQAVAVPPRFLGPSQRSDPFLSIAPPSVFEWLSAGVLLVLVMILLAFAVRHRDVTGIASLVLVLGLGASAVFATAAVPREDTRVLTLSYTLLWLIPMGLVVWVVVSAVAGRELARHRGIWSGTRGAPGRRGFGPRFTAGIAAMALVATIVAGALTGGDDPYRWLYPSAGAVGDAAAARVTQGRPYRIEVDSTVGPAYLPTLAYRVRRAGAEPVVDAPFDEYLGAAYRPSGEACAGTLAVRAVREDLPSEPASGAEVLTRVEVSDPRGRIPAVIELRLVPDPTTGAC